MPIYTTVSAYRRLDRKGKPFQAVAQYKDENGVWRHKTKILKNAKGQKEADRMAEEWLKDLNKTAVVTDIDDTITAVVEKYLDAQYAKGEIGASTKSKQWANYNLYAEPYVGDLGFKTTDRTDIETWITQLHNKGFSQQTIYIGYSIVRKAFTYYYNIGELNRNPCAGIKVKKGDPKRSHLTDEQMANFVANVCAEYNPGDPMYTGIFLAYYAGLRRQEICALRWRDINFETKTITISSAIGQVGTEEYTKDPKNPTSARTFPIIPQLLDVLRARYKAVKPKQSWFVIGNENEFMKVNTFSHNFQKFRDAYGLIDVYDQKISSHLLRHNMGMVGIRSGMDISSLSRMFGHASRAMTLDRYGDSSADAIRVAAEKLSETYKKNDLDE